MKKQKEYLLLSLTALILVLGISGMGHAITLIDTTGSWNGSDFIWSFGESNSSTYGQTFTVTGSETKLDSFSFFLDDYLNPDFVDFEAYVYAWDGYKATGSALYASSPMSTTNNGGSGGFENFTLNTGGISLNSGSQYVAFLTASNMFDGSLGTSKMGGLDGANVYSGGQFVFLNNGSDFGQILTNNWTTNWKGIGADTAFTMNLSDPVPEPATLLLFALGIIGLAGAGRKKYMK